jgi:radical SAM protein with 4Fe4S-binding SPASM domain
MSPEAVLATEDRTRLRKLENSRRLREDLRARRVVFTGLPEIVSFQTTEICNLRCIMCPRHEAQGKLRLDAKHLLAVAEELFPTAWKAVFTGAAGEPLMSDVPALTESCLRHGVKMDVFTNGVLLSPDRYRRARAALDQLNISLDGGDPETYEKIREGSRWDRMMEVLSAIRDIRACEPDDVLLSFSAVVMRSNLASLVDLVRLAHRMGADGVVLQKLRHEVKRSLDEDPEIHPGREAARPFVEAACETAHELGVNLYATELGIPPLVFRPTRPKVPAPLPAEFRTCSSVAQNFAIMPTGDVYPCCVPNDHVFGNVRERGAREIWNSPAAQALRAAHFSGRGTLFCRGCLYAADLPKPRFGRARVGLQRLRLLWSMQKNASRHRRLDRLDLHV